MKLIEYLYGANCRCSHKADNHVILDDETYGNCRYCDECSGFVPRNWALYNWWIKR